MLDISVIDVLPKIQALTGCDVTNIIGTKRAVLMLEQAGRIKKLTSFGKEPLTWDVIAAVQEFLLGYISNKSDAKTFNEIIYELYQSGRSLI